MLPSQRLVLRQRQSYAFLQRFGRAVRATRRQQHLSQEGLARQSDCPPSVLCAIEGGHQSKLPLYTSWCLSQGLEVPLDVLCGGCDPDIDLGGYQLRRLLHCWAALPASAQDMLLQHALALRAHPPKPWRPDA